MTFFNAAARETEPFSEQVLPQRPENEYSLVALALLEMSGVAFLSVPQEHPVSQRQWSMWAEIQRDSFPLVHSESPEGALLVFVTESLCDWLFSEKWFRTPVFMPVHVYVFAFETTVETRRNSYLHIYATNIIV